MTTDLPPHSIAAALELVDAVRLHDPALVAHTVRNAADTDGLEALCRTLAAMVDDQRTLADMLAWTGETDVQTWRRGLTDMQCRDYHSQYNGGSRDPEVIDGNREWERRRTRVARRQTSKRLRKAA